MSINPSHVVSLPTRVVEWAARNGWWNNTNTNSSSFDPLNYLNETQKDLVIHFINSYAGTVSNEDLAAGILVREQNETAAPAESHHRSLKSLEEIMIALRPNITTTNWTTWVGPWLIGRSVVKQGACRPIEEYHPLFDDPSVLAVRALGILASLFAFAGILVASWSCSKDAKTRHWNNRVLALIYGLAFVSTCLTYLMFNANMCQDDPIVTVTRGELEGLAVGYGRCQCRAGCILNVFAAACYLISTIAVLQHTGYRPQKAR